ncbi:MAG: T9SS type A sorting domain-containing protein [Bacteroidales bacterium]|nr:T9SS type A sorting domain-containing protein [Bacteroidales bacterium]MCF8454658.1 T9SS type A sorting domain-containing protein [Bacteroidales bacterium]
MRKLILLITVLIPIVASAQWNIIYTPSDQLNALAVIDKDTIMVATYNGGRIHRTTDGGQTWWPYQTIFSSSWFLDIDFPTKMVGYACGGTAFGMHTNVIAKTTDGGQTWDSLTSNDYIGYSFSKIHFLNADTGFVRGEFSGLLKTTDGGISFIQISLPNSVFASEIYFQSSSNGFVGTYHAPSTNTMVYTIIRTDDLGDSWTEVYTDTMNGTNGINNRAISELFFADSLTGFAVGGNGLFLRTTDGGLTWAKSAISPYTGLSGLYFTSPDVGYINNAGGISQSADGGNTWQAQNISPPSIIWQIGFATDSIAYAVGDYGIYKTTNAGQTLGLADIDGTSNIFIFPNPATEMLSVNGNTSAIDKVSIFNLTGKLMKEVHSQFQDIKVSDLANGIYLVSVLTGKETKVRKFVKE